MAMLLARSGRFGFQRMAARGFAQQSRFMSSFKYAQSHEYAKVDAGSNVAVVGISDFAQTQLGDVVFVDLPSAGEKFEKGESFASVESVKAASEVYAPVSGTIIEVNEVLADSPELVNQSAMSDAWFVKLEMSDASELDSLLSEEEYTKFVEEES